MKHRVWLLTVLMLAALLAGCGANPETTTPTVPSTSGEPTGTVIYAPDFTVYNEKGEAVKLSDFRGKPVVLNFWASWCSPCKAEMPEFDEKYRQFGDQVQFMMVNLTIGDDFATAKNHIDQQGYAFPVFYDQTGEAAYYYSVQSIPVTFFITARGQLLTYRMGMMSGEELEYYINVLLTAAK